MTNLRIRHLRSASLATLTLCLLLILTGLFIRPTPSLTWTVADTEYTLILPGTGPLLLSVHDPTRTNLPLPTHHGDDLTIDWTTPPTVIEDSRRLGIHRTQVRGGTAANNAPLTITCTRLPLLYVYIAASASILPGLSLGLRIWRRTAAILRDRDRRAAARFRVAALSAGLCLLAAVALPIASLANVLEASCRLADYQVALHSTPFRQLRWDYSYPVGPWTDASDAQAVATHASRPTSRRSALGLHLEIHPSFAGRVKPESFVTSTHPPADFLRPLRNIRLVTPFWLPLPLLLLWPAWFLLVTRRRRHRANRLRRGLCLSCGYDLRSSPTRCPECGTPAPST